MTKGNKHIFNIAAIGVRTRVSRSNSGLYMLVKAYRPGELCAQCAFYGGECVFNLCGSGNVYVKMDEENARRECEKLG